MNTLNIILNAIFYSVLFAIGFYFYRDRQKKIAKALKHEQAMVRTHIEDWKYFNNLWVDNNDKIQLVKQIQHTDNCVFTTVAILDKHLGIESDITKLVKNFKKGKPDKSGTRGVDRHVALAYFTTFYDAEKIPGTSFDLELEPDDEPDDDELTIENMLDEAQSKNHIVLVIQDGHIGPVVYAKNNQYCELLSTRKYHNIDEEHDKFIIIKGPKKNAGSANPITLSNYSSMKDFDQYGPKETT